MTVPLQAGDHGNTSSYLPSTSSIFDPKYYDDSQIVCERTLNVFPMTSSSEDIIKGEGRKAVSFFSARDKEVANLVSNTYQESVPVSCLPLDISELSETHVSLCKKEGCLAQLKRFFLRILAILKKFFCRKKRTESKSEKRKRSLLEKKEKVIPSQRILKYILVTTRPRVLVDHSTQTDPADFLKDASVNEEKEAFYISLMLKDMWIKEEGLDLYRYKWCMLTMLTQCLQNFYKLLSIEERCLIPNSHVTLSDDLYLEWEQYIPNNEDLLSIVCSLLETLNGKVFCDVLEEHAVSEHYIKLAKKFEDELLPSQVKLVLALIARHCITFTSRQARELQELFVISSSEAIRFVNQSLLLLSQLKKVSLITWVNLMQILAYDAIED